MNLPWGRDLPQNEPQERVMLGRISVHSFVRATVNAEIGLSVTVEIQRAKQKRAHYWLLIDARVSALRSSRGRRLAFANLYAAWEIASTVFANEASSPTFKHVFDRSICRINPQRTLPGPTSMNVSTPCEISSRIDRKSTR